jgi:hypothetical protein
MSQRTVSLRWLASRKGPITAQQLGQIKAWIDADWESHDIDRNARRLIERLAADLWNAKFSK